MWSKESLFYQWFWKKWPTTCKNVTQDSGKCHAKKSNQNELETLISHLNPYSTQREMQAEHYFTLKLKKSSRYTSGQESEAKINK